MTGDRGRSDGTRVVVVGASGNVGTSVVEALSEDPGIGEILAVARRDTQWLSPKVQPCPADVLEDDLASLFTGADVVIHLAWIFQPTHDPLSTWRNNVQGSIRVFEAVARANVPALVYASSVGAYSPGPKDREVDEHWPTHGWPEAAYTREKAYLERYLDSFESRQPDTRVVRLRPGFIFKEGSAAQQRRLFMGPLLPNRLVRPDLVPVIPDVDGMRVQVVHSSDVGEAYRLAAVQPVQGAFNLAVDPIVDGSMLAELFGARAVRVPSWPIRAALAAAWGLRLVPASPHLFDAVLRLPLMDTSRARTTLGWSPRYSSADAIMEFVRGLRRGTGSLTPPLQPRVPGGRVHEIKTGVGQRE